ncbi:MAG: HEAT repeat domain-containing protein [Phototrophicaceae bacterium]
MTDDTLAGLIADLAAPTDQTRRAAFDALAARGAQAVESLIDALTSPDSTIRASAADLLGEIQDERAVQPLYETATTDSSRWVRSRAESALAKFPPGSVPLPGEREPSFPARPDTLEKLRSRKPDWPTLGRPPTSSPSADPASFDAQQVRAMLDQLDMRLASGEISEATYNRLVERWQARLRDLGEA